MNQTEVKKKLQEIRKEQGKIGAAHIMLAGQEAGLKEKLKALQKFCKHPKRFWRSPPGFFTKERCCEVCSAVIYKKR